MLTATGPGKRTGGYHECPGCSRANVVTPPPVADRRLKNFSGELQYVCRCGRKNSITFKP